ncbi:hypothetical protein, partial [Streptomyces microflavus]|uniref:hypothetical protein n=1 Tax=Streptomyces microflavus TaxID=1919 RepID=UPI0033A666DB
EAGAAVPGEQEGVPLDQFEDCRVRTALGAFSRWTVLQCDEHTWMPLRRAPVLFSLSTAVAPVLAGPAIQLLPSVSRCPSFRLPGFRAPVRA